MESNMKNDHIEFNQRKITKSYRSITGHFPSIKNNKSIGFDSKLEKALFLTLEFDNNVIAYQEQPQIEIYFNDKNTIYSADCYIQRVEDKNSKSSIVEAKYVEEIEKEKEFFERKFKAVRKTTESLNLDFEIYTEENHSETYLDNIDFLYRYKLNPIQNRYENKILELLKHGSATAYVLTQKISKNSIEYAVISNSIWDLVAQEKLKTDLYLEKLSMNSIVEIVK